MAGRSPASIARMRAVVERDRMLSEGAGQCGGCREDVANACAYVAWG